MESAAHLVIAGLEIYAAAGAVLAAAFLLIGLDRIDPAANGSYAFRPLLVPGLIMLWPLVAIRWTIRARETR
ncbi:MAG TPA: hypothetical protein VHS58_19505 [Acetobacteraceae bacterium]|nr:hypothetical protein [Acetobacteraceae bacterium]